MVEINSKSKQKINVSVAPGFWHIILHNDRVQTTKVSFMGLAHSPCAIESMLRLSVDSRFELIC